MQFVPKTQKQLDEEKNFPPGDYPFEIISAKEEKSKAGNQMIHLKLKCFAEDDRAFIIDDYLMESMGHKLLHFCEETGLAEKYEAGTLKDYDCDKKEGIAQIYIQKSKDPQYSDKNSVKDYGEKEKKEKPTTVSNEPDWSTKEDDSVPM